MLARLRLSSWLRAVIAIIGAIAICSVATALSKTDGISLDVLKNPDGITRLAALISAKRDDAVAVAIIDVDDETFLGWGTPTHIDRERLANLLRQVSKGQPAGIVIDVDFSFDTDAEIAPISRTLAEIAGSPTGPPVFLVRSLQRVTRLGADGGIHDRPTRLDAQVKALSRARWVTAYFDPEDDGIFRRWKAYRAVCNDGGPRAYPTVALATTAMTAGPDGPSRLDRWLAQAATSECALPQPSPVSWQAGDPDWLRSAGATMMIPYGLGFTADVARFGVTVRAGQEIPTFIRLGAGPLLASNDTPELSGRIAVIGATHAESRDLQRTPLGIMPGLYVIANLVAFGGGPLEETRLSRLRPFAIGLVFFTLHLAATVVFLKVFAATAVFAVTILGILICIFAGVPAYVVYEGAVIGLLLVAAFLACQAVLKSLLETRQVPDGAGWVARHALSDRALGWLHRRR